ncbi:MAG: DUF4177 domain-containing protein [Eubacteriaceae bacterium]|jgi:hypothetical protein
MKKYEYVTVKSKLTLKSRVLTAHRDLIDEYAAKGYTYVGYIPTNFNANDVFAFDLIFEIDE